MSIIYLIEDDYALSIQIQKNLEKWGYQTHRTQDFQHLDEEVKSYQPDLILLDIHLPYYDGFYWCEKIRKETNTPILFLSSANEEMNIIHALSLGGDAGI
ncbi:response regulator [Bulleidia sp. zg-1006]|uniref:response regulator n=1 Tax=Bulleidia sp. zg-1006 TaxID=2806552 RepID=UPI001939E5BE|nr:response regulator [Bulleidia sp. zg-1006]QRG86586.1 response regulator [Bulleidia sp. zg-1006]